MHSFPLTLCKSPSASTKALRDSSPEWAAAGGQGGCYHVVKNAIPDQ